MYVHESREGAVISKWNFGEDPVETSLEAALAASSFSCCPEATGEAHSQQIQTIHVRRQNVGGAGDPETLVRRE
jgi:hypothetical protein